MSTAVGIGWIPDTATFGARIALVRWKMGWNIKEAAVECGLTPSSWANWESGMHPRNYVEAVNRIVLRTRVDKMWLMTGEGSPEPRTTDYKGAVAAEIVDLASAREARARVVNS